VAIYLVAKVDGTIRMETRLLEPVRGPDDRYAVGPFPNHDKALVWAHQLGYTPDQVQMWVGGIRIDK